MEQLVTIFNSQIHAGTVGAWTEFAAVSTAAFLALWWTRAILVRRFGELKGHESAMEPIGGLARRPNLVFLMVLALCAGSALLSFSARERTAINDIVIVALILQCGLWLHELIGHGLVWSGRRYAEEN